MSSFPRSSVGVRYSIARDSAEFDLVEDKVPESIPHDEIAQLLKLILAAWAEKHGAVVARNLALRWDQERPANGVDPDVAVYSPPPPDAATLTSVRTWIEGHAPPKLAIEIVSETNPHKDYELAIEKYALCGAEELWVLDPFMVGPRKFQGPFRLQIWRRTSPELLSRVYAGDGPAFSQYLNAWLVVTDEGRRVRIAEDEAATRFWRTGEEEERAAKEAALAEKAALLARIAELEAAAKKS